MKIQGASSLLSLLLISVFSLSAAQAGDLVLICEKKLTADLDSDVEELASAPMNNGKGAVYLPNVQGPLGRTENILMKAIYNQKKSRVTWKITVIDANAGGFTESTLGVVGLGEEVPLYDLIRCAVRD